MIVIVPSDPAWPGMYELEAQRLRRCFGAAAVRIDHVGSTSVPGLAAKAVIDIQVSLQALGPAGTVAERLAALGYHHVYVEDLDHHYPFFQRPAPWPGTHHLHLCQAGHEQEWMHLALRDYLRRDPGLAREYEALKRSAAGRHDGSTPDSRRRYTDSKTPFVMKVLRRAAAEGYVV